ncbi:MAG: diguanylate cyclase [Cyanobacteria bacterium REEB67]|nr:diguanylate cyclase [Cyanobacteria bacterium REEB67]
MSGKKFDVDEGWAFARENKFNRMVIETRFDRQKFKETQHKEIVDRERKPLSDDELEEMERASLRDPVTALFNQRTFLRKLEYELRRAKRYKRPLSLMVLSVDNMSSLKRQYGQMIADDVMKAAARIVEHCVRDVDISGRAEGMRIGCIFPETYSSRAMIVAERVRERIRTEPVNNELRHLRVTISVGVVSFPTHARDEIELMNKALEFASVSEVQGGDRVHNG